jgi:hypothetical protein
MCSDIDIGILVLFQDLFIKDNTGIDGGVCDAGANTVLWQYDSTDRSGW